MTTTSRGRCSWCGDDPLYIAYHDDEWGVPLHDDRALFEMLVLEGFQAGLSWITILRKRENFRRAFSGFDPELIAGYTQKDFDRLLLDEGIVRNKLKVAASALNAQAYLKARKEFRTFDNFIWQFTNHQPVPGGARRATSPESDRMSKELLGRGFKFVGSTICYAFMQATGMIDDHAEGCFKHRAR